MHNFMNDRAALSVLTHLECFQGNLYLLSFITLSSSGFIRYESDNIIHNKKIQVTQYLAGI